MTTLLKNALIPEILLEGMGGTPAGDGLVRIDLAFDAQGFIAAPSAVTEIEDLGGKIVLPAFVDAHVHLDKAYIARRTGISRTGLEEAVGLAMTDLPNRTANDLRFRMDRAIRAAVLQGTVAMRSHLDSMQPPSQNAAWAVLGEMRERWQGLISLQAVALMRIERALEDGFAERCADIARHDGLAGGYVAAEGCPPEAVDAFLRHAEAAGLDVDFHVDESLEDNAKGIETILGSLERTGFAGRVVLGHCCALSAMPEARAMDLIARLAAAKVHVVSLPFSNMFLQDRSPGRTARMRGLTMVPELDTAGVPVIFASDNVQDPFYPYGGYDLLEVLRVATLAAQLEDAPESWIASITKRPGQILAQGGMIAAGKPADLIVLDCDNWLDFHSKPHADRRIFRDGRPLDPSTLPRPLEARP